ncbi:hypothetical protein [Fuerstiella marisgermanici]|nr:hypothetical protein [Fuerstiella marisgermanici]
MRNRALALNILTAVLFAAFFAYTFFAKQHLQSLAREFVVEKTVEHAGPVIDTVEDALDVPLLSKLMSRKDLQLVRTEIEAYRENPAAYIADLAGQSLANPPPQKFRAVAKKTAEAKQEIRDYYDRTLAALIADLRIFSGTNIAAAILAIVLIAWSRTPICKRLVAVSIVLFSGVVLCSYMYIDSLSFFRIITHTHMGWWYPVFVIAVAAWLYQDVGGAGPARPAAPAVQTGPDTQVEKRDFEL